MLQHGYKNFRHPPSTLAVSKLMQQPGTGTADGSNDGDREETTRGVRTEAQPTTKNIKAKKIDNSRQFTSRDITNVARESPNNERSDSPSCAYEPDPKELDDPTLYPRVLGWLKDCDEGPRGRDQANFSPYAKVIDGNGFARINQLSSAISPKTLSEVCPGMSIAHAAAILKFAQSDTHTIRASERERLKKHPGPKRYS